MRVCVHLEETKFNVSPMQLLPNTHSLPAGACVYECVYACIWIHTLCLNGTNKMPNFRVHGHFWTVLVSIQILQEKRGKPQMKVEFYINYLLYYTVLLLYHKNILYNNLIHTQSHKKICFQE